MRKAIRLHPDAEVIFFLGDGLADIDEVALDFPEKMFYAVRGNCDFRSIALGNPVKKTEEVFIEGRKIVLTHGDLYDAKYGTDGLCIMAVSRDADIVLFGHTHTPYVNYFPLDDTDSAECDSGKPFYLFNPGSIGEGKYSFGVITLSEGSVLLSHGSFL